MRQIVFACEGGSYSQRRHEKKSTVRPPLSEDVLLVTDCFPSRTMAFSCLPMKPKYRSAWVNTLLAFIPEVHSLSASQQGQTVSNSTTSSPSLHLVNFRP